MWQPFATGNNQGMGAWRRFGLVDVGAETHRFPRVRALLAAHGPAIFADLAVRYQVLAQGQPVFSCAELDDAITYLDWAVTTEALAATPAYAVYHSAVLTYRGRGLLLPAASGSGKTTLTAALLRAGFVYLSDEAALVDPATLRAHAYPKRLSIKRPTLTAQLLGLPAHTIQRAGILIGTTWQVDPAALGAAVCDSTAIAAIVFPQYQAGHPTALRPLGRAATTVELLRCGINARAHPPHGVALAAALAGAAPACARLAVNDLTSAIDLMTTLMEQTDASVRPGRPV